jgi:hypothetical protein
MKTLIQTKHRTSNIERPTEAQARFCHWILDFQWWIFDVSVSQRSAAHG